MEDYLSIGKERAILSTKALQEVGMLWRSKAKVLKLYKICKRECIQVSSNKAKVYNEMVRDAMVDYNAIPLELKECNLR